MIESLAHLTNKVNEVLAEENGLLEALDLPAAVALLGRKRTAVAALQSAVAAENAAAAFEGTDTGALRESLQRLTELGEVNRVAIERGLALQMRLIQTIAQAVPRTRSLSAPIYQPDGSQSPPRPPEAFAFLSRM